MKNKTNTTGGFTLIELLVVISIIGVLTALLLSNFVGIRGRAADAKLKGELGQLKTSLRLYYNDFQQYPGDSGAGSLDGCGTLGTTTCAIGDEFSAGSDPTVYMKRVPEFSEYDQIDNGDGFTIGVILSNASDADIAESISDCGITGAAANTFYVCAD